MPVRLSTYRKGNAIPPLPGTNIFHSTELFHVFEMTRGYEPLLIVAYIGNRPVGKLLAVIRKSMRLFPPAIIKRCEIYGTGEYFDEEQNKEDLFGEMLEHLTNEVLCKSFLIEFRNLENPLFGYKAFRKNNYFAINWLRVRNSLHSKVPYERLSMSRKRQINKALRNGAIMEVADNEKDIQDFSRMLKKAYSSQVRKHFPDIGYLSFLKRKCLSVVLRRYAENLCFSLPRYSSRMGTYYLCSRKRICTFGIHGCRITVQKARLQGLYTPLWRQAEQYTPLVPLQLEVAEQTLVQILYLIHFCLFV